MNEHRETDAEEILSEFQKTQEPGAAQDGQAQDSCCGGMEPKAEQAPDSCCEDEAKPAAQTSDSCCGGMEPKAEQAPDSCCEDEAKPAAEQQDDATPGTESAPESGQAGADGNKDAERRRDVIFVGTKPIMTYVTATLTQLADQSTVTVKARGRRITQAVDVSQMIVKRMDSVGYVISDVRISSDALTSQDGKKRNVSTIEIDITEK